MTETQTPVGATVAQQVRRFRKERGWSVRQLADECARVGATRLTQSSLANIERGLAQGATRKSREVTADELVALALALRVSPLSLLLPVDKEPDATFALTKSVTARRDDAWRWGRAEAALPDEPWDPVDPARAEEFERLSLPAEERHARRQTAGRLADEVRRDVYRLLSASGFASASMPEVEEKYERYLAAARASVDRLNSEIDRVQAEHEEVLNFAQRRREERDD